jgi:hypothetical protein
MLIRSGDLWRFRVRAVDGEIGRVQDLQMDDRRWVVRDIVVDVGHWLTGHLVLIRPAVVGNPDRRDQTIDVKLTAEQIADAPSVETHPSVSRQHSVEPYQYLGLPLLLSGLEARTPTFAAAQASESDSSRLRHFDLHLRSIRALSHYAIDARDGEAGHVEDWIVDVQKWRARYAVVKTAGGRIRRHVLVPVHWLGPISWSARAIYADLPRDAIIHAPEHAPAGLPDIDYEIRLHRWYGHAPSRSDAAGRQLASATPRTFASREGLGSG